MDWEYWVLVGDVKIKLGRYEPFQAAQELLLQGGRLPVIWEVLGTACSSPDRYAISLLPRSRCKLKES